MLAALHPPDADGLLRAVRRSIDHYLPEDLPRPWLPWSSVEDHEMRLLRAAAISVRMYLSQSFLNRFGPRFMQHLQLDDCLSRTELFGANLSGSNLTGSDFTRAYLVRADLSGSTLKDVKLDYADLTGANLRDAHLQGIRFENVFLNGTDLSGANLRNALFLQTYRGVWRR